MDLTVLWLVLTVVGARGVAAVCILDDFRSDDVVDLGSEYPAGGTWRGTGAGVKADFVEEAITE